MVQEMADKKHIQCAFITKKPYSRSWGNKARKDLGYNNVELQIHPHNDILGAIGYQEGEVLVNHGFRKREIKAARKYYKNRLAGKKYRDHVKTMVTLSLAQVNPIRDHIMADHHVDTYTAENLMVKYGFIWPGMKTTDPYVQACRLREEFLDPPRAAAPISSVSSPSGEETEEMDAARRSRGVGGTPSPLSPPS